MCADHGPCVSGAHNTIVTARAGKDLISCLVSGLLTIGPRFGGAIDDAARCFREACDRVSARCGMPPPSHFCIFVAIVWVHLHQLFPFPAVLHGCVPPSAATKLNPACQLLHPASCAFSLEEQKRQNLSCATHSVDLIVADWMVVGVLAVQQQEPEEFVESMKVRQLSGGRQGSGARSGGFLTAICPKASTAT